MSKKQSDGLLQTISLCTISQQIPFSQPLGLKIILRVSQSGVSRMFCLRKSAPMVLNFYLEYKRGPVVVESSGLDILSRMWDMISFIFSNLKRSKFLF